MGHYTTQGENKLINFPISFNSIPFAIASPNINSGGALSATKYGFSLSKTGFYVSSNGDVYWTAIGY